MITSVLLAFSLAAIAYGAINFPISHFRRDIRDNLSLWLLGAYDDNWANQFCLVFDQIFGDRHFGIKCFFRSAIASLISVFGIYIILGEALGVLEVRTSSSLSALQAISIALFINLLADYISLLETRWVLNRLGQSKGWPAKLRWLILDLLFTGLIIWTFITAYILVRGGSLLSVPELLGVFSIYSIFFYSTFVTSIWSLGYMLTTFIGKLFSSAKLGILLDVEENPGGSLGLIFGIITFFSSLAAIPLITPDDMGRTVFDRGLCKLFPASTCLHAARISSDPLAHRSFLVNACFFDRAGKCSPNIIFAHSQVLCEKGDANFCAQLGVAYRDGNGVAKDERAAAEAFERGCDLGSGWSCAELGRAIREGSGVAPSERAAAEAFERGCDLGSGWSCGWTGLAYRGGTGVAPSERAAAEAFERGCDLGSGWSCGWTGWAYREGTGVAPSERAAAEAFERGCDLEDGWSCGELGRAFREGNGVTQSERAAAEAFERGCDLGEGWSCGWTGWAYREGTGVAPSERAAAEAFERGCDLEDGWSCGALGWAFREGKGVTQSERAAAEAFERGCNLGYRSLCEISNFEDAEIPYGLSPIEELGGRK